MSRVGDVLINQDVSFYTGLEQGRLLGIQQGTDVGKSFSVFVGGWREKVSTAKCKN
jgi:hypothetical protein